MGLWFYFSGGYDFNKKVDPEFKERFNSYVSKESWDDPNAPYGTYCPWFIDDNNKMAIEATKFGDHGVWLEYVTEKFLEPEGYSLSGEITFTTEVRDEPGFYGLEDGKMVIVKHSRLRNIKRRKLAKSR